MNGSQRKVLVVAAIVAGLMLLIPPYREAWPTLIINLGYQPLFLPPTVRASVNLSLLAVQLGVVAAIAAALVLAMRDRR
jgi:hypothetical protein